MFLLYGTHSIETCSHIVTEEAGYLSKRGISEGGEFDLQGRSRTGVVLERVFLKFNQDREPLAEFLDHD